MLSKAQSLVAHGHLELAVQTWQQVLLSDPANREAVLGIAKADMQLGKTEEARKYIQRLQELGGSAADLAQIEQMPHVQPTATRMSDARHLASAGKYADAMKIYRDLFPHGPPAGDTALEFYETEAAVPELRREATDRLQALAVEFSADPRYAIALGRIQTYDPRTRAEGVKTLRRFDNSPEAQQALKQALTWNGDMKKPGASSSPVPVDVTQAIASQHIFADPREGEAYRALNSGHLDEAQQQFDALLLKQPNNARAISGLGYVAMKRGHFADALQYLEKARTAGAPKLVGSIAVARFWVLMEQAASKQQAGNAEGAARDYRNALIIKPGNSEAEEALAGTLLQAGNTAEATAILKHQVAKAPENDIAWRKLFVAQAQLGDWREALATSQRMPGSVESRLESDPEYLGLLIKGYLAANRKQDADRITQRALALPFPDNGRDLSIDKQLQYAALLMTIGRYEPALRLYRQVIDVDPQNAGAWLALVAAEHQLGKDDDALATIRKMPRSAYDESQKDAGFLALLGSIYQSRKQWANAEKYLERAVSLGVPSQPALKNQLADVYLALGEQQKAYSIYRGALDQNPDSMDAWRGLLAALHQSHHDREALHALAAMPGPTRIALEHDAPYLQTLASIQSAVGQDKAALQTFELILQAYLDQQTDQPVDVQIQYGWLLLKADNNRQLYSVIASLAQTPDLTEVQQTALNQLWSSWSMRRASSALEGGEPQRAIAILESAAQTFPRDVDVYNALAGAYLRAGQPKRAVAIYASLDLSQAPLAQYRGAIGAALAAHDMKHAEVWLQAALDLYKTDAALLKMAAQYEQTRGDARRAAAYYRAALEAMGPETPAEMFPQANSSDAHENSSNGNNAPANELMRLLAPSSAAEQGRDDSNSGKFKREANVIWRDSPRGASATLADFGRTEEADQDTSTSSSLGEDEPASLHSHSDRLGWQASRTQPSERNAAHASRVRPSFSQADPFANDITPAPHPSDNVLPAGDNLPQNLLGEERPTLEPTRAPSHNASADASLGDFTDGDDAAYRDLPSSAPVKRVSLALASSGMYADAQIAANGEHSSTRQRKTRNSNPVQAIPITSDSTAAENLQDAVKNMAPSPRSRVETPFAPVPRSQGEQNSAMRSSAVSAPTEATLSTLPPLTGALVAIQPPRTPREQIQQQLAVLEGASSNWIGGTSAVDYRSGQPGYDRLAIFSGQAETSTTLGPGIRTTFIVRPVLLDAGKATGTDTIQQGTLPLTSTPYVQSAAGLAGEFQLQTSNFGARIGTTPRGFLVQNYTAGLTIHPVSAHFTLDLSRDPILDTQLSFAGLRDEGSRTAGFVGNSWGGVIANSGQFQVHSGDALSGWYIQGGGQYLTGLHVATNKRLDGNGGAYWTAWHSSEYGRLVAGMNFFGMHYQRNLRYFTYGQGGYFSPGAYMLAAVPLTFHGHYGDKLHYRLTGSLGMQAFQEDSAPYFPLNPAYQSAQGNPAYPERTSVGGNYDLEMETSYTIADHWYVGAYTSFNNSRNYASDKVGFFVRFLSRPQPINQETGPTGLFPVQGMRPLQTP